MKERVFKISDGFSTDDLLKYAIDHLESAYLLFQHNPICFDSGGYLSHLGLELILKSILLNKNGEFPAIHDLKKLYKIAKKSGFKLNKSEEEMLEKVNQFYYLRYADPKKPIEIGDDDWVTIKNAANSLLSNIPGAEDIINERYKKTNYFEKGGRILMRKKKEIGKNT
jgi:HEPN domain-containing protein